MAGAGVACQHYSYLHLPGQGEPSRQPVRPSRYGPYGQGARVFVQPLGTNQSGIDVLTGRVLSTPHLSQEPGP